MSSRKPVQVCTSVIFAYSRIQKHIVRHCSFPEGANGDGMAVISSLRSFDREQQKEYLIPIVIKDSGNPAMTGTSTLTVTIRDVNDNKMQPGSKEIFAYNYMVNII